MPGNCRWTVYKLDNQSTLHLLSGCMRGGESGENVGTLQLTRLEEIPVDDRNWCGRCGPR